MSTPTAPRTTDALDLQEAVAAGRVRVLDVRTPAEFETMHIPGAYNVPLDTLKEHREELSNHLDEDVVLRVPLRGPRDPGRAGPGRCRPAQPPGPGGRGPGLGAGRW